MLSAETGLPIPPMHAVPDPDVIRWITISYIVLVSGAVAYALMNIRKAEGRIICLALAAGAVASLSEPILDLLGAAWYPIVGIPVAFELMGRPIPIWIILAYTVFFGFVGSFTILSFRRGITQRQVWLLFLVPIVLDIVQQELFLHLKVLIYYGNQPLILLWKFPFWWAPCDSFGDMLAAAVFYHLLPYFKGVRRLLLVVIYPIVDFIGYAAVGLAGFNAVNSQLPTWLNQSCGALSWVLVIPLVHLIAKSVASDANPRGFWLNHRKALSDLTTQ
jgi:hypothetical protein